MKAIVLNLKHFFFVQGSATIPAENRSNGIPNGVSSSVAWRQETLQAGGASAAREVDPTLYEELKLGQDGAGFKRLKP